MTALEINGKMNFVNKSKIGMTVNSWTLKKSYLEKEF